MYFFECLSANQGESSFFTQTNFTEAPSPPPYFQDGSRVKNRTETETRTETGTVFPGTVFGSGTAGTVSRNRNRNWNRPLPVKLYWNTEDLFLQRNRQNRKPEPLEPFHAQTVTEPNRGVPEFSQPTSTLFLAKLSS